MGDDRFCNRNATTRLRCRRLRSTYISAREGLHLIPAVRAGGPPGWEGGLKILMPKAVEPWSLTSLRLGLFAIDAQKPDNGTRLSRNPRKNFFLSVNYLTLLDRFLNDAG
jgi:hypothetical protein